MVTRKAMTCAIARYFVKTLHAALPPEDYGLTGSGRVLSEVLLLVPAEEALGLRLGSRTTRELAVEVDHSLHADSICCGTKTLLISMVSRPLLNSFFVSLPILRSRPRHARSNTARLEGSCSCFQLGRDAHIVSYCGIWCLELDGRHLH